MTVKMPISKFVEELEKALNRKDGYIMGTKGQDPKKLSAWYFNQYADRDEYTAEQEAKAQYWKKNAQRVWDCNGLAEGIYEDYTGVNINTKARYNYAQWCEPKGTGMIPAEYRVPGAAVFTGDKASTIPHVMYLYKPVVEGKPDGDWYLIEARGVMYGVVKTKLYTRKPTFWGLMTKYFDYGTETQSTTSNLSRNLREGCEGEDVKILQTNLIRLGYDCGDWGIDGDFGDATELALRKFQKDHKLVVDGIYGEKSHEAMEKAIAELSTPVANPKKVKIVGGNCYIRSEPNTSGIKLDVARKNETYQYGGTTSENGWNKIVYENSMAWVSGNYSEVIE